MSHLTKTTVASVADLDKFLLYPETVGLSHGLGLVVSINRKTRPVRFASIEILSTFIPVTPWAMVSSLPHLSHP
jgi:hypothetical protein